MTDWNEDKYKYIEESKRASTHDCINKRDECDIVHPNIARNVLATLPSEMCRAQPHPKKWRDWLLTPKVTVWYMNQHTLKMECFNMTEVFSQMSTNAKLNVMNNMFTNLLDENEKSLFLSDLLEKNNAT